MRRYLAIGLVLFGCADGGPQGESPGADTEASSADYQRLELGENRLLEVGWGPSDPPLFEVSAGAIRDNGGIAFFADGTSTLYLVDVDGGVTTVGREGDGPGEFRAATTVLALPGDSILVYDRDLLRINVFDPAGEYTESYLWQEPGRQYSRPAALLSDGRLGWIPNSYAPRMREELGRAWIEGPLLSSSRTGTNSETIRMIPMMELRYGDGSISLDAFGRFGVYAAFPGGFVHGQTDVPELHWVSAAGETVRTVRLASEPRAVTDEDWDEYEAAVLERFGDRPDTARVNRFLADSREYMAETVPLFGSLHVTDDGTAWLGEYRPYREPSPRYLVIEADGGVQREVLFPRPVEILDVQGSNILGVMRDELDVEAVVLYRLPGGGG